VVVATDDRERPLSALCRTRDGYLLYAHSDAIDPLALAHALASASCQDALLLAGGRAAGFAVGGQAVVGQHAPQNPSPSDMFFLHARELTPTIGDLEWTADSGAQPAPSWMPAVFTAKTELLGASIDLSAIAVDRFHWEIRPGEREKAGRTAERELAPEQLARAQIAISLGVGFRSTNRRGLVLDGVIALPIRPDLGVLSAAVDGRLTVRRSVDELAPPADASELRLLAEGGQVRSEAKRLGARRRRAAACILADRTLLIAMSSFDSAEPNTNVLLDLGCTRVVDLNRGKQVGAFIHRAGTDHPPQGQYDDTILYGMSGRATGRARPLDE
jgi:hypothetical protein